MFKIVCDDSCEKFLGEAGELLYQDEPTNSLMLGLCEGMKSAPPKNSPLLLRIVENDKTVSAAIQTPPMNLVITYCEDRALVVLADHLKSVGASFPGVVGPAAESEFFAAEWTKLTTKKHRLGMGQKIYKLENVLFPQGIDGTFRVAKLEELEIVSDWLMAFAKESLPASDQRGENQWNALARAAVEKQNAHFWIKNDQPVSMAFASRPTKNGVTVNAVYTPPGFRKNGFASAVVAHLSQKLLDTGKNFCVLYTDLANPTSNKIYQDIGYREVADSKLFVFE